MGIRKKVILIIALEFFGLVLASFLAFPWAVVESIGLDGPHFDIVHGPGPSVISLQTRAANKPE